MIASRKWKSRLRTFSGHIPYIILAALAVVLVMSVVHARSVLHTTQNEDNVSTYDCRTDVVIAEDGSNICAGTSAIVQGTTPTDTDESAGTESP